MNKKAFTLIELLVVVLIIGILSAVALPQYEVSVLKTRYANLTLLAETYFKAAQATQLAIGEWPDSFDVLDVSLPGGSIEATPAAGHCGKFKDSWCCLLADSGNYQTAGISCGLQNYRLGVAIVANSNGTIMYKECFAKANDSAANQVCKGMATYAGTGNGHNLPGPTGHIIGMNGYQY